MAHALDGIRIVEVGEGKQLAYCGKLLRDLGAEVIKVEPPHGDQLRLHGPSPTTSPEPSRAGSSSTSTAASAACGSTSHAPGTARRCSGCSTTPTCC